MSRDGNPVPRTGVSPNLPILPPPGAAQPTKKKLKDIVKKAAELPPPPPNATLLVRLLTHPPSTGVIVFDYTPRVGCNPVPPPPPPPPPKKSDAKDGKGKPSAAPGTPVAAAAAAAPPNPFARASSPASLAFAPSKEATESAGSDAGSDAPPPPIGAITFFGDEEVRNPLSFKAFAQIMRETVGGGGVGPGPGWSKWWRASQEDAWLSMMPPMVKKVYHKEIDLAPDEADRKSVV